MFRYPLPRKNIKGFTLVELSIVIAIIGLIVAGVTAGQSLVNAAKLRKLITDINKYKTAINAFRLQYNAIPGDIKNATSYWSSCVDDVSNSNPCNGNGNNLIDYPVVTGEAYRFWQHLALAGLIPGSYTGTYTSYGWYQEGVNIPATAFKGYVMVARPTKVVGIYGSPADSTNHFHYHNQSATGVQGPLFTPDAYALDKKVDDGKADSGWIGAEDQPCVTATYLAARSYARDQTTAKCRMFIYW